MFDLGFSEIIVISVVALVVVGPERLPKVARTVGHLLGRAQRYVADVKSDIQREMQLEELQKLQEQVKQQQPTCARPCPGRRRQRSKRQTLPARMLLPRQLKVGRSSDECQQSGNFHLSSD